jgi:hypothetical protein
MLGHNSSKFLIMSLHTLMSSIYIIFQARPMVALGFVTDGRKHIYLLPMMVLSPIQQSDFKF